MVKTNTKKNTSAVKAKEPACIKPRPLKKGDKVGIVAPASRPESAAVVALASHLLNEMGYVPIVGANVLSIHGYMAGTDEARASDFNGFIKDKSIRGIFCITGGYGSLRILKHIDFDSIARNPKIIVGGDENTCLLNALNLVTGLVCFHGPNLDRISSKLGYDGLKTILTELKVLKPIESVESFPSGLVFSPIPGTAEGALVGGNLSALFSLIGTKYQPDFQNKILFLEDRNERHDVIERWLTGLRLSGNLNKVNGVAMGIFENCGTGGSANMLSLTDTLDERLQLLKKPSCLNLNIGQSVNCRYVPIGIRANLDSILGRLEFLEPALSID